MKKGGSGILKAKIIMIFCCLFVVFLSGCSFKDGAYFGQEVKIITNGEEQMLTDQSGCTIYPLVVNGVTYLPLRAIGELFDINIIWDDINNTIILQSIKNGTTYCFEQNSGKKEHTIKKYAEERQYESISAQKGAIYIFALSNSCFYINIGGDDFYCALYNEYLFADKKFVLYNKTSLEKIPDICSKIRTTVFSPYFDFYDADFINNNNFS